MKNRFKTLLFLVFVFFNLKVFAQTIPVGSTFFEENLRRNQLEGNGDSNSSFTVRPIFRGTAHDNDSFLRTKNIPLSNRQIGNHSKANAKGILQILPLTFKQQFQSHHPFAWNDGAMVPTKGYQNHLTTGIYTKVGPLSIQLQPELVYAQNSRYPGFSSGHHDSITLIYYTVVLNRMDAPEKYGNKSFVKAFTGQSSIRFNLKKLSFGLSTENLWWGPGIRNSLIMSNNAPGFPHLTLNTTAPLLSTIGTFEGQLISGLLKKSGYIPADTNKTYNGSKMFVAKPTGDRYINGVVMTWQPRWTKGLFLGFTRVFYQYKSDVKHSFKGYLPVIGQLFKGSERNARLEDAVKRDQMLSFFFRLLLPKEKAEIYAEYGRNDFAGNIRDLLLEPEHARAYIAGFRKIYESSKGKKVEVFAELTNLQLPSTFLLREQGSWYMHHQVLDGYTNQGQVIGAGIGPGGNSQSIGMNWISKMKKTGLMLERVTYNNDFYYTAFAPAADYWRHWVDLSVTLNKNWQHKRFLYDARISYIASLNYQWQRYTDAYNLYSGFSVSYLF